MLRRVAIQFSVLFIVILIFDLLIDWAIGLFDLAIELIHLGLDAIEYSIELILEYTLHTGHQVSEIIIVNSVLVLLLFLMACFIFSIPKLSRRWARKSKTSWLLRKRRRVARWRSMLLATKVKLVGAYIFGTSCLLFLVTL